MSLYTELLPPKVYVKVKLFFLHFWLVGKIYTFWQVSAASNKEKDIKGL